MKQTLVIAEWRHLTAVTGSRTEIPWADLKQRLSTPSIREERDGPGWSPAIFETDPPQRRNEGVESLSCLVLDCDTPEAVRAVQAAGQERGLTFVLHGTHRSRPEALRGRAVFPLLAPVAAAEWPWFHDKAAGALAGGRQDKQCKDPARFYWWPASPQRAFAWRHAAEGEWLDPREFLRPPVELLIDRARGHLGEGRNAAGMWLACQLRDNGYNERETEGVAWEGEVPREKLGPRGAVDVYDREEWLATVRKVYGRAGRLPWTAPNGAHPPVKKARPREAESEEGESPLWLIKGFTAEELLKMEIGPAEYAIPGFVCEGLNILAGGQKTGKSWLAYGWALSVAQGGVAMGQIGVKGGEALYLALEDGPRRLQERLKALLGESPPPRGLHLYYEWPAVEAGGIVALDEWLADHPDVRLIVIDTLGRFRTSRPRDGDVFQQDYTFGARMKRLADEHHLAIVLLHHLSKRQSDDPFERVSGTIAVTASADATLILHRKRGRDDATLFVTGRDVEEREMALVWSGETCNWSLSGTADEYRMSQARREIIAYLAEHGPTSPKPLAECLEKNYTTTKNLLMKMQQAGELVSDHGVYRVPPPRS